jgi:hypothetical protein
MVMMVDGIGVLGAGLEDDLRSHVRDWRRRALNGVPADWAEFERGLLGCYRSADLPPPGVVLRVGSPLALARALWLAGVDEQSGKRRRALAGLLREPTERAVEQMLWEVLGGGVVSWVRAGVFAPLDAALRGGEPIADAVADALRADQVADPVGTQQSARAAATELVGAARVGRSAQIWDAWPLARRESWRSWRLHLGGMWDSAWCAYASFLYSCGPVLGREWPQTLAQTWLTWDEADQLRNDLAREADRRREQSEAHRRDWEAERARGYTDYPNEDFGTYCHYHGYEYYDPQSNEDYSWINLLHNLVAAQSADWWFPHRDFVLASERPVLLHADNGRLHCPDGPAVAWPDGWQLYFWHGMRVPEWVITGPTVAAIAGESNVEVRRCAIEAMGWDAYLDQAGLSLVDSAIDPGNPGCRLELYHVPEQTWGSPLRVLLATNGSPERDGTRRRYALPVPADMDTALNAAAWTYGLAGEQYADLIRRT